MSAAPSHFPIGPSGPDLVPFNPTPEYTSPSDLIRRALTKDIFRSIGRGIIIGAISDIMGAYFGGIEFQRVIEEAVDLDPDEAERRYNWKCILDNESKCPEKGCKKASDVASDLEALAVKIKNFDNYIYSRLSPSSQAAYFQWHNAMLSAMNSVESALGGVQKCPKPGKQCRKRVPAMKDVCALYDDGSSDL